MTPEDPADRKESVPLRLRDAVELALVAVALLVLGVVRGPLVPIVAVVFFLSAFEYGGRLFAARVMPHVPRRWARPVLWVVLVPWCVLVLRFNHTASTAVWLGIIAGCWGLMAFVAGEVRSRPGWKPTPLHRMVGRLVTRLRPARHSGP